MHKRRYKPVASPMVIFLMLAVDMVLSAAAGYYIGMHMQPRKDAGSEPRAAATPRNAPPTLPESASTLPGGGPPRPADSLPPQRSGISTQPDKAKPNRGEKPAANSVEPNEPKDSAATEEGGPASPTPAPLPASYIAAIAALGVTLLGLVIFFLVIQPRRKRRPLLEALEIIKRDDHAAFPHAEELLSASLIAGMRARDIAEARFALAYIRSRLGRFSEAATVLAELMASGNRDRETLYLALWLQSRLKDDDKVERLYSEHAGVLGDLLDTRVIAGITFLRRAWLHWSRREVDGAMHYFDQLRQLDVLTDEIPSHIDDHQVVLGIMSLFDNKPEDASRHFSGAVEAARKQDKPTAHGKLGLLLCKWRAADTPDIDEGLGQVLAALRPDGGQTTSISHTQCDLCMQHYSVAQSNLGKQMTCPACKQRFVVAELKGRGQQAPADEERLLGDDDLLLRNVLLWYAVSLLFTWKRLAASRGLPLAEHRELLDRLARVKAIDPEMPDADLIEGLIGYYFGDEDGRQLAVAKLDRAIQNGVNVPEVLTLVEREQRLAELERDRLRRFFELVKNYLHNPTVPEDLRSELKLRLEKYAVFKQLGEVDLIKGEYGAAPSVEDIQNRGALLLKRVNKIIKTQLARAEPEDRKAIDRLMARLNRTTRHLSRNAELLEQVESRLLGTAGEFLLNEEEALVTGETVGEAAT
jgi:hypothetical protein